MSASVSAEEIKKMMTGNTTEQYLGSYGNNSPLLDLVNRLSGQLNQQTAESNLYRGGAGYGGSFMNAEQVAAREAGGKLNAKPYGGWGGYGSANSTMTNSPDQGPPDIVYGPQGGGPADVTPTPGNGPGAGGWPGGSPANPGPGGGSYIPGDGSVDTTGIPPRSGYGTPPVANPPTRDGSQPGLGNGQPPVSAPPRTGGTTTAPPRTGGTNSAYVGDPAGGYQAFAPPQSGMAYAPASSYSAPPQKRDPAKNPYKKTDPEYNDWNNGVGWDANEGFRQQFQNPQVQQIYDALVQKGMRTDSNLMESQIQGWLDDGASPSLILENMGAVVDKLGPSAFSAAHGMAGRGGNAADLQSGKWVQDTLKNMGADPGSPTKRTRASTTTASNKADAPGGAAGNLGGFTQIPDRGGTVGGGDGGEGGGPPVRGGGGGGRDGGSNQGNTGPNNHGNLLNAPGKNWGPQATPPKGAAPGDYWQLPNGTYQTVGYSGTYHTVTVKDGKFGTDDRRAQDDLPSDKSESAMDPGNRVKFTNQAIPGASMTPKMGQTGIIGYDTNGNPIYNDNYLFEQGDNGSGEGDVTPDAWSNSPDWRPEEPTGGVYGAYTDLAGGKMTDYENAIGQKWRDMADNPATQGDQDYYKAILDYNKTPGKGIDEAYGAYNNMINSDGYSAAEKGAMEGSAVAGVSNGFQQAGDEMRRQAARTNNPAAAYAAMASGGAAYGATLGETNRQNQIKFADEAQRRKEEGASGMVNVAGLANTKAQFGLGAQGEYERERARKKEAAVKGMGDYATFGRGLQAQGVAGLQGLLDKSDANKNNTYAQIAAILGTNTGQKSTGSADTKQFGWNAGVSV